MALKMGCVRCSSSLQELGFLLLVVLLSWLRVASAFSKEFTMSEYCGDLIDMEQRHLSTVRLRLTDDPIYRPHMSCSVAVRAPPQLRLLVVAEWMDIKPGLWDTCSDYLSIWDGDLRNKTGYVQGLDEKTCGDKTPPSVTSRSRALLFHFDSNTIDDGAGFYLIITAFHTDDCFKQEFRCDNGRCIDNRLNCDAHNNCGDDSDNCILSPGQVVIAVVVTTIVFLLIVGAAFLYCHKDKLKLKVKKKCPTIEANPDGVYQPTTEPVTASTSTGEATTAV